MSSARITRLLVANRGEIASRVFRTARDLGMSTVAVHSDPDADAPFVREADRAVRLPGASSLQTYLDGALVIDAARRSGADAIHPGYGFLSENPGFARAVVAAGLVWVGPPPAAIEAMALKVEAKRIAERAGVPLAPGAELPGDVTPEALVAAADAVGYPLLVKASAGGGGKGMRIVRRAEDVVEATAAARNEATSAFGDGTVFLERYLEGARHIEVQVFGDQHGTVLHLLDRECSIQRRHQKVIEEAPAPALSPRVRTTLHESAVALAREIGYVGAGTVEFLVRGEGDDQECFFLEMNTRLQVEHPVTEAITGIDLVAWQLAVAQGRPLPVDQESILARGHAIEARLYAEDPAADHQPSPGVVHRFAAPSLPGLRVDAGVADGSVVTTHYDPMLAKVIAHADSRAGAADVLAAGLARMTLHGPVTNRDSLVAVLRSPAFRDGTTTTAFLDLHAHLLAPLTGDADIARHAEAAAAAVLAAERPDPLVPLGWRNVPGARPAVRLQRRGAGEPIDVTPTPDARVLDGSDGPWVVRSSSDGVSAECRVARYGDDVFVDDGLVSTVWHVLPRFADHTGDAAGHGATTPVPGTITAVHVAAGDSVTAGALLVVLEAMKMEHRIVADADGVVARVLVEVGQSVDAHALVVELEDGEAS